MKECLFVRCYSDLKTEILYFQMYCYSIIAENVFLPRYVNREKPWCWNVYRIAPRVPQQPFIPIQAQECCY